MNTENTPEPGISPELGISTDKLCYIIIKAREWDVKVDVVNPNPGSNESDGGERAILEDYANDPTFQELHNFIANLNEDEQIGLVALTWVGRGTFGLEDWDEAISTARTERVNKTEDYLMGIPLLADYLDQGMQEFDLSCDDVDLAHL